MRTKGNPYEEGTQAWRAHEHTARYQEYRALSIAKVAATLYAGVLTGGAGQMMDENAAVVHALAILDAAEAAVGL